MIGFLFIPFVYQHIIFNLPLTRYLCFPFCFYFPRQLVNKVASRGNVNRTVVNQQYYVSTVDIVFLPQNMESSLFSIPLLSVGFCVILEFNQSHYVWFNRWKCMFDRYEPWTLTQTTMAFVLTALQSNRYFCEKKKINSKNIPHWID